MAVQTPVTDAPPVLSRRGVTAALVAAALFAAMAFAVHMARPALSSGQLLAARGLVACVFLLPAARRAGPRSSLTPDAWPLWLRCAAGVGSIGCYFWTLRHCPVAGATALADTSPLFVLVLSWILLREASPPGRIVAGVGSVAGAMLVHHPWSNAVRGEVVVVGLLGAGCAGLAYTSLRRAAGRYGRELVVWCLGLTMVLVSVVGTSSTWVVPRDGADWLVLAAVGILGLLAQLGLTTAYTELPATVAATLGLTGLLFGLLLDVLLGGSPLPGATEALGYVLVLASGVAVATAGVKPPAKARLTSS